MEERIPVLIVYVTCDYSFTKFGDEVIDKGPCVLLLRRGFYVADMKGQWSVVAGVDDIIDSRLSEVERKTTRVYDEIKDETTILHQEVKNLVMIGQRDQQSQTNCRQVFQQCHFWAEVPPQTRISICHEHTGGIWMPLKAIQGYLEKGKTNYPELQKVIEDGVVPGFWEGMQFLVDAFRQRYPDKL